MIKIYTVYNDALINLLEKFFEMKKSECKETIGVYRRFLMRQESVQRFLQLAEVCHCVCMHERLMWVVLFN